MADTKIIFQLCFIFLTYFNLSLALNAISVPNEWDCLKEGWPIEDKIDHYNGKRSQFYYNKDANFESYIINIKDSFKTEVEKEKFEYFKLSFKFWFHSNSNDQSTALVNYDDEESPNLPDDILKRHKLDFENKWMPCEYILKFKNLDSFQIRILLSNINSTMAFKDFMIDYEKQENVVQNSAIGTNFYDKNSENNVGEGFVYSFWNKYINPPRNPRNGSEIFFYFSDDCYNVCELTISPRLFPKIKNDQLNLITESKFYFQYWIKGNKETNIKFQEYTMISNSKDWQVANFTLTKGQYNNTIIKIKTTNMGNDDISFIAIKNFKFKIITKITNLTTPHDFECQKPNECRIMLNKSSTKLKQTTYKSSLTDDKIYYFPISEINSITYTGHNNIDKENVCFSIDYSASKFKNSILHVFYNALQEKTNDKIISIKPKVYNNDDFINHFEFCLRDYLVLNSNSYMLKFVIYQPNYDDGIDGFAISVSKNIQPSAWDFESFTFLQKMEKTNIEDESTYEGNWQNQWKPLSKADMDIFSFEEDTVKFTAIASSEIPANAQLMSKWIKYDDKLLIKYSKYQLKVSEKKIFKKFKVQPKICDWLSHCHHMILESTPVTDNTTRNYNFKFLPLKNSPYIRLVFDFEYFKTDEDPNDEPVELHFKLIHFGDPCFETVDCNQHGVCISNPTFSTPNQLTCSCRLGYIGVDCKIVDKCNTVIQGTPKSGKTICRDLGKKCENDLNGNFRCICYEEGSEKIIWNGTNCVEVKKPNNLNWTENVSSSYSPTNKNNSLIFTLTGINMTLDVCATFTYTVSQQVNIEFLYNDTNIVEDKLFDIPVSNNTNEIEFCIRDFRYSVYENFQLIVRVKSENYTSSMFSLQKPKFKVVQVKKPLTYIAHWDHWKNRKFPDSTTSYEPSLYWKRFPEKLLTLPTDSPTGFYIKIQDDSSSKKSAKVFLISDWIENYSNFSGSENIFSFKYDKGLYNNFDLKQYIIFEEKYKITPVQLSSQRFPELKQNSPFKIMIEINYHPVKEKFNFTVTLQSLSLGDPCFNKDAPVCKNLTCIAWGPNNYKCDCKDVKDSAGINCDIEDVCKTQNRTSYCETMPSLPKIKQKCSVVSKNVFECDCPKGDYKWDKTLKRCQRNFFIPRNKTCEEKKCEFLDTIDGKWRWSYKNLPEITSSKNYSILPIYFPTKNGAQLKFDLKKADNKDSCIKLFYTLNGNSRLDLNFNNNAPLEIYPTSNDESNVWLPEPEEGEEMCISDWSKSNKTSLTFTATIKNSTKDMIAIHYNTSHRDLNTGLLDELPFLTDWKGTDEELDAKYGKNNFSLSHQWPLTFPKFNWLNDNSVIHFKIFGKNSNKQSSYLISQWLSKEASGHDLRFNLIGIENYTGFLISVLVFNDTMKSSSVNFLLGDKSLDTNAIDDVKDIRKVQIPKQTTSFRIAFKVDYISSKIEETEYLFSLNSIDLGDPCFDENGNLNNCNGIGRCERNLTAYKHHCNCKDPKFRSDTDCKYRDSCKFNLDEKPYGVGNEYCKTENMNYSRGCLNKDNYFECDCVNKTIWDESIFKCVMSPQCITHECNKVKQRCVEPGDTKGAPTCICDDERDYYNISNNKELNCVKYDPCILSHRKMKEKNAGEACGKSNAKCISFNSKEYTCICPEEYINSGVKEDSHCVPRFCSFPSLNPCEQRCEDNDQNYTCSCENLYVNNGSKCSLIKEKECNCTGNSYCGTDSNDCICKKGYIPDIKNKKFVGCKPDVGRDYDVCPYKNVTTNSKNEVSCFCGTAYKINGKNTCDLKPICGKGGDGRKDCTNKKALCKTDTTDIGNYFCECPFGMDFNDENSLCLDKCELKNRKKECASINAICNPLNIKKNSNSSEYCTCKPGFVKDGNECVLGAYTQEISISIKDTFTEQELNTTQHNYMQIASNIVRSKRDVPAPYSLNLALDLQSAEEENAKIQLESNISFIHELTSYLTEKMQKILLRTKKYSGNDTKLSVEKCYLNSAKFYDCTFTITSDAPYKNLGNLNEQLAEQCIQAVNDPKTCFFPESDPKLHPIAVNIEKLNKTKTARYQPCDKSRNAEYCPELSKCNEENDTSLFWCTCDTTYFISIDRIPIKTSKNVKNAGKYVKHICGVREDICEKNCPLKKDNGLCEKTLPEKDADNNWIVKPYCYCNDGYILSNNSKQCSAVCDNQNCNHHGSCKPNGHSSFACDCQDGWGGENCNKELKNGVGGWIAGIVVLAVLLVIASGVALIFARRARRTDYSSGQQLDEYTGPSFRTNTSGAAPSRNQPAYQGRDNQAFHRD